MILSPGPAFFLGDPSGKSNGGLGFFREAKSKCLAVGQGNPKDARAETHFDDRETLAGYCPEKPWVKLLLGCGVVRFWISADGVNWARACDPWTQQHSPLGSVGLYCGSRPITAAKH